ncbi:MAG: hypothetical protein J6I53_09160, partial [Treponema sp.]|nr:hypothetical protein [Treponema sp.]
RREYYMIFTEPLGMAQRISDICHLLSSLALRNRLEQPIVHLRGKFFCYKLLPTTRIAGGLL